MDTKNAKLWEEHLKIKGLTMYMKKGGSQFSKDQPFVRNEASFLKAMKFEKLLDLIYTPE